MTIGIVTTCHTYYSFIPGWLESIRNLSTQPDQIVIAATDPEECRRNIADAQVAVIQASEPFSLGTYLNTAIEGCETDWIVWIGIDDRYRPHALDGLNSSTADVIAYGILYSNGTQWIPASISREQVLSVQHNLIPCGSPFRRQLWKQIPFQEELNPFEDWGLWVGFASLGANFAVTKQIDFDYSQHSEQIIPPMEPTRSRILEWSQTLGKV